jgi:hypothetical protein
MQPDMDRSHGTSPASPGYETRDANTGGVYNFLAILAVLLAAIALVCFGLFRFFTVHYQIGETTAPFLDRRQVPMTPQLQVNPREEWLKYREQQNQSLESYAWVDKTKGIVQVPVETAMQILVKKGLPVEGQTPAAPAAPAPAAAQAPAATGKAASTGGKKP